MSSGSLDTRLLVVLDFCAGSILELPGPSDSSDSELSTSTEEARGRSSVSFDSRVLFCFLTADFPGSTVLVFALPPRGGLGISEVRFSVSVFAVLLLACPFGSELDFEVGRFLDPDLLLALSSTTCWNVTVLPFDLDRDLDADLDLL